MRLLFIVDRPLAPPNMDQLLDDARRQAVFGGSPSDIDVRRRQTWMVMVALPAWRRLYAAGLARRMIVSGGGVSEDGEVSCVVCNTKCLLMYSIATLVISQLCVHTIYTVSHYNSIYCLDRLSD